MSTLPKRPNLEHLRRQAKWLLAQLAEGDPEAAATFIAHLPAARAMRPEQVRSAGFRLADAQSAIARKSGFAAWPALARHVEQLRALEGTWSFEQLEVDGSPVPAAAVSSSRILIDGDRFRTESPEATYEGVFTIDVEEEPAHLDIDFVAGPEAGRRNHAIYRLAGDELRICIDVNGKAHPTAFTSTRGSGHAHELLRRVSVARPADVHGGTPPPAQPTTSPGVPDPAAFAFRASETLSGLEGDWAAVEIVRDGNALPAFMLKTGSRAAKGNHLRISFGGQVIIDALVRIDESASPVHVDYCNTGGAAAGTLQCGIFEWRGAEACFCMGAPGGARPTEFSSAPGSGRTLSRWKKR